LEQPFGAREAPHYRCVEATPEFAEDGVSVIGVHAMMQDVSSKKREERRLIRLARVDSLTGLLNRTGFYERLKNAIERSRDQGTLLALFYLDIDYFKQVNDAHGHAAGTRCSFAVRLAEKVRASDVVARLGGDEFTLVMEGIPGIERVRTIAANLVAALGVRLNVGMKV
jgi:PleD family two-component response regulator